MHLPVPELPQHHRRGTFARGQPCIGQAAGLEVCGSCDWARCLVRKLKPSLVSYSTGLFLRAIIIGGALPVLPFGVPQPPLPEFSSRLGVWSKSFWNFLL